MAVVTARNAKEMLGCLGFLAVAAFVLVSVLVATKNLPEVARAALVVGSIVAIVALLGFLHWRRGRFIRTAPLPIGLYGALQKKYPHLTRKECELAAHALRHFFLAYRHGGYRFVAMPSQAADELWHAFILHTRAYADFCSSAFGRFLHHTPAVALGTQRETNAGLRRCWWQACKEENIDPRKATRLPLLFALDAKLSIPDGFRYSLDCHSPAFAGQADVGSGSAQCASDFGDASVDGSTDGFGDGDGGGDSGGDGDGGGCGGGCGGD
jgi:hypothetical protein